MSNLETFWRYLYSTLQWPKRGLNSFCTFKFDMIVRESEEILPKTLNDKLKTFDWVYHLIAFLAKIAFLFWSFSSQWNITILIYMNGKIILSSNRINNYVDFLILNEPYFKTYCNLCWSLPKISYGTKNSFVIISTVYLFLSTNMPQLSKILC